MRKTPDTTRHLTDVEKRFIVDMRLKNQSLKKIAEEIGISQSTLSKRIKEDETLEDKIKISKQKRFQKVEKLAQDAVELLLKRHTYLEKSEKFARVPRVLLSPVIEDGVHLRDRKGNLRYDETPVLDAMGAPIHDMIVTERTVKRKVILPNPTVAIWAACNTMPDQYKSINKAEVNVIDKPNHSFNVIWQGTKGSDKVADDAE